MENIYLKTKNKKTCNGCTACAYICPVNAIDMKEDNEGFIYPVIDETLCIKCGKCLRTCSNFKKEDAEFTAFAVVNKNKDILNKSTSGGAFYAILESHFKNENSVCYGAAYDENFKVTHMRAASIEDSLKFMGSKYVRSDILGVYPKVKEDLENGKNVLFTGTPCIVNGLYTYLNKEYNNLLTSDIICHSNPSPKVFHKYIKCLEVINNKRIKSYTFRAKENGWRNPMPIVEFEDGEKIEEDTFQKAFSRGLVIRPVCTECKFLKPQNYADITLGDFWGVEKITNITGYQNGISLVLANTKKGLELINKLENIDKTKLDKELDVFKYNHNTWACVHRNKERFFKALDKTKTKDVIKLINKMSKERLLRRVLKTLRIK